MQKKKIVSYCVSLYLLLGRAVRRQRLSRNGDRAARRYQYYLLRRRCPHVYSHSFRTRFRISFCVFCNVNHGRHSGLHSAVDQRHRTAGGIESREGKPTADVGISKPETQIQVEIFKRGKRHPGPICTVHAHTRRTFLSTNNVLPCFSVVTVKHVDRRLSRTASQFHYFYELSFNS